MLKWLIVWFLQVCRLGCGFIKDWWKANSFGTMSLAEWSCSKWVKHVQLHKWWKYLEQCIGWIISQILALSLHMASILAMRKMKIGHMKIKRLIFILRNVLEQWWVTNWILSLNTPFSSLYLQREESQMIHLTKHVFQSCQDNFYSLR